MVALFNLTFNTLEVLAEGPKKYITDAKLVTLNHNSTVYTVPTLTEGNVTYPAVKFIAYALESDNPAAAPTVTGELRLSVSPNPNCPLEFNPQAYNELSVVIPTLNDNPVLT